ncbi:MAG TPA: universal stress protein, partial [Anaerolineae bacterium]|nr:universal stress protein [Anaerolineae bacterium]
MRRSAERKQATVIPLVPTPGLKLARILVPVANPATARGLIQMASALGAGRPAAELVALKIVTAPRGVPIEEARRYILSMREQYEGALAQATGYAVEAGLSLSTELQVAGEAAAGILDYAGSLPDLGLLLLGWRGAVSGRRLRGSINQAIVSRAQSNVAVLRLHGSELGPLRKVLLPVGWGPHARLGLRL